MKIAQKIKLGFTIVELLVVISIIAILAGIVTSVASNAIKNARERRKDAMRSTLQAGLNVYNARNNTWPKALESRTEERDSDNSGIVKITGSDADSVFQELVSDSFKEKGAPYLDPNGLFVATATAADTLRRKNNQIVNGAYGQDFSQAIKKAGKGVRNIPISQMAFGYPDKKTGYFVRYKIEYNTRTDSVTVTD